MAESPQATMRINHVRIKPNQVLTIYAHGDRYDPKAIQIEVRVLLDGRVEIFADEQIPVQDWDDWEPLVIASRRQT